MPNPTPDHPPTYMRYCGDPTRQVHVDHHDGRGFVSMEVKADSIIERAARAASDEYARQNESALVGEGGDLHDPQAMARAVLRAIREPSEGMIDEAYASYDANGGSLRDVFMDMIDAALGDD